MINLFLYLYLGNLSFSTDIEHASFLKGMTISCQTWGKEWATPEMKTTMNELKGLGINAIAIHPYARITEEGRVKFRSDVVFHITTPTKWARELNMQIMLVPHLAYWGTRFKWRGDINFSTQEEWDLFFLTYKEWILQMAELAENYGADVLCIGSEYRHAEKSDSAWRDIIAEVRNVYRGKLVYAANWDTYEAVTFWDALDYIGIQAYFPLVNSDKPTESELIGAWESIYQKLIPFAAKYQKKIVFTEIGYDTSKDAARQPWKFSRLRTREAYQVQQKCLEVALKVNTNHESLAGIFLWKWFPETQSFEEYENYNLQRPQIKDLIHDLWHP